MRCLYCYNEPLLKESGRYGTKELYSFLISRIGKLDAVVLSGGEASTCRGIVDICKQIKAFGFKIKLDTNGSKPELLKELIQEALLDFVSLDFKATKSNYKKITQSNLYDEFLQSLKLLMGVHVEFEVRTTLHDDLINESDLQQMIGVLQSVGYKNNYYIQKYLHTKSNIGNLQEPIKSLDLNSLVANFKIVLRNFR